MNFIGKQYSCLQEKRFWKFYYAILGIPFMSAHLIYDVMIENCKFRKGSRIFDYGTGDGIFINQLSGDFGVVGVGIDRLPNRIKKAKDVSDQFKLENTFICAKLEDISLSQRFDKVLCLDVLEHLVNPAEDIKRISSMLNLGGELIIQTPRDNDKKFILKKEVFTYGHDEHTKSGYSLGELKGLLEYGGLSIKYWRSTFPMFSQVSYELLEMVRLWNKYLYSIVWPFVYPLCILDFYLNKKSKSNGLFIIATKK